MAVIRILTITVTADVDSRFQNLGFASPPFNMGDKDGFLGWSYETTMYTVPLQTATFLSGPQQSEITLASADPNNNRKQVWDILLTENCIDCSGSYVFRHQSQQIDDFTVTNIVFYRYEQPVVGEGDLFTSLYLYRDDFDISGDQKFLVGDTIGVLARIIDLESAGVSGVSYRTATLCAKNNPTQTCADVSSADRVTLINNFLPITTGTAQKFEVSGAASPSGSETTSAAFTFKAHSLNGKRSLTLEVVVNINVGRRMREMNLRLNIPDRVLASVSFYLFII